MDTVDKTTRSRIMGKVGQKNTGPEMRLRKSLHKMGARYRLHDRKLPGSPDIVFSRFKAVVFVHGCFWHRHGCKATTTPCDNEDYWHNKFEENRIRDKRNIEALIESGWRVAIVWECVLKGKKAEPDMVAKLVMQWLNTVEKFLVIPCFIAKEAKFEKKASLSPKKLTGGEDNT
jgi:DNA mismatch endonuclease (patch repair protein)